MSTGTHRRRIGAGAVLVAALVIGCGASPPAPPAGSTSSTPLPGTVAPTRQLAGAPPSPLPGTPAGTSSWAPWPAALHDARHSGATSTDGPTVGRFRWRRQLEGPVTPGPVVGRDGTIYVASNGGVLHALDPATGIDRWRYDSGGTSRGGDLSTSALVLPDGTLLWGPPGQRRLLALSPSGSLLWDQPLPGRPTSPTTTDGRRVYVGDTTGHVTTLAVGPGSHRVAWTRQVGSTSYASVVTDGAGRVYTTADSALIALDDRGADGAVAWRVDPDDDITEVSPGLAPDGTVLLGTNGTREWAYRPDGSPRWNAPRVITYSSPAASADGLAYVPDHSGQVHVLRVSDGSQAASYQLDPPEQIWSSVAVDRAHRLYFGTQDGHLLGVAPGGEVLFDLALGGPIDSYPALTADGALIAGDRRGELVAID